MTSELDGHVERSTEQAKSRIKGWHNVVGASAEELDRAEIEALFLYGDIIDMPAHVSPTHPRQPRDVRAAQFAPFAALTGYEEVIEETARRVDQMPDLDEDERARLDAALSQVEARADDKPLANLTYFEPDLLKDGGRLITVTGAVARVARGNRTIALEGMAPVPLDSIVAVEIVD